MAGLDWSGRTVLVAGGAGFVGSALVRILADLGARLVSFDDNSVGCSANLPTHSQVEIVEGDACDAAQVLEVLRAHEVEFLFHCIGDTFVPEAYDFPQRFFERNVGTTLNLLRAAKDIGTVRRVLYVSSTEVYGETDTERTDERCDLRPLNTYAVSKLAADRLCHTYYLEHSLPVIVARIFNCYGPRATHPYIIPEIIRQLHEGPRLMLGNLESRARLHVCRGYGARARGGDGIDPAGGRGGQRWLRPCLLGGLAGEAARSYHGCRRCRDRDGPVAAPPTRHQPLLRRQ